MGVRLNRRELNGHMEDWLFQSPSDTSQFDTCTKLFQYNLNHFNTNQYMLQQILLYNMKCFSFMTILTWTIRQHYITCYPGVKPLNLSFIWNRLKFFLFLMFIILNIFLLLFLVSDNIEELDTSLIQVNASKAEVNAKEH